MHDLRVTVWLSTSALICGLLAVSGARAQVGESYSLVARWPVAESVDTGALVSPVDLAAVPDGRVYVSDAGIGGVHIVQPSGDLDPPFGLDGEARLASAGPIAAGPVSELEDADWRIYVLDTAARRIAAYSLEGQFLEAWAGMDGAGIAADLRGRVYLADRERSQVVVLDATGSEIFALGERGTGDGQFAGLTSIDVLDLGSDGTRRTRLAVGDRDGLRVQYFEVGEAAAVHTQSLDLASPRFRDCRVVRLQVADEETVLITGPTSHCFVSLDGAQVLPSFSREHSTLCGLSLPLVVPEREQYFGLTTFDPRPGSCRSKDATSTFEPLPAIVRMADRRLLGVEFVALAKQADQAEQSLIQPQRFMLKGPDSMIIEDRTGYMKRFGLDGRFDGRFARIAGDESAGSTEQWTLSMPIPGPSDELVFARYERTNPLRRWSLPSEGVGLFRRVIVRDRGGDVESFEAVWANDGVGGRVQRLVYNELTDEVVALVDDYSETLKTRNELLRRWSAIDGVQRNSLDLVLKEHSPSTSLVDVATSSDGDYYVLDQLDAVVRIFGSEGAEVGEIPVARDSRAIAVGALETLFVLRASGVVERLGSDGSTTARFDGRPFGYSSPDALVAIAADDEDRVYTLDEAAGLVSVFEPGSTGGATLPALEECSFATAKSAEPDSVLLGSHTEISLTLDGRCGIGEPSTDIVLVVREYLEPFPPSAPDPSAATIGQLQSLVAKIDLDRHRVALIFGSTTTQALTSNRNSLIRAVERGPRVVEDRNPVDLDAALDAARSALAGSSNREAAVVLFRPAYCYVENHFYPSACRGFKPAESAAAQLKDQGVRIIVGSDPPIDLRRSVGPYPADANHLASSDADVVVLDANRPNLSALRQRIIRYEVPDEMASDFELFDEIPANMRLDPDSVAPQPGRIEPVLTWTEDHLPQGPQRFSYLLEPLTLGRWPTNVSAVATFVDGWGKAQRIEFPIPEIEVVAPTPTLEEPTTTPTPTDTTRPTPKPSPTAGSSTVYLPVLFDGFCIPKQQAVDVVLVVDVSSSMAGEKLDSAKDALRTFLGLVRLGVDRAAIVSFAAEATLEQSLTTDRDALERQIGRLSTGEGTRIDLGLAAALDEIEEIQSSSANAPVVVVLSDGQQEDPQLALAQGNRARWMAVTVHTIGLGEDADRALLRSIATADAHAHFAPTAAQLAELYERIAFVIPCR